MRIAGYFKNSLLIIIMWFGIYYNGMNAQQKKDNKESYTLFYVSLCGGWTSFGTIENEIEDATIEAGGRFFNNNTKELTEFSQKNVWSAGLSGGINLSENFFCELKVNYFPGFTGEFTSQDLQHDAIFTMFDIDVFSIIISPGYSELLNDKLRWFVSIGAGYSFAVKRMVFYGMAFGRIGNEFNRTKQTINSFCASASLGLEYYVFDFLAFSAEINGIKHFLDLKILKSVSALAGIKYVL